MNILSDKQIKDAMIRAIKDGQLYGDDGKPLPEKAVAQLACRETLKRLLPKDYYPKHLTTWADSLSAEWGYESTLTAFLRELATNWKALNQSGEE